MPLGSTLVHKPLLFILQVQEHQITKIAVYKDEKSHAAAVKRLVA
jgi:hypothetical protein